MSTADYDPIEVHLENSVVFPGSIIRGFVKVSAKTPIENVVALRLKIVGKERLVRKKDDFEIEMERQQKGRSGSSRKKNNSRRPGFKVTTDSGDVFPDGGDDDDDKKGEADDGIESFTSETTCIYKQLVTLYGNTKDSGLRDTTQIPVGEYTYPFEFSLPQNIPCSYHSFELGFGRGSLMSASGTVAKDSSKSETMSNANSVGGFSTNSNRNDHHLNEENQVILSNYENYLDSVSSSTAAISDRASTRSSHHPAASNLSNMTHNTTASSNDSKNNNNNNNKSCSSKATIAYYIKSYLDINTTAATTTTPSSSHQLKLSQDDAIGNNDDNNNEEEKMKSRVPVLVIPAVPNRQWLDKCPCVIDRTWDVKKCLGCFGSSGSVTCKISLDRSVLAIDRDAVSATVDIDCSGSSTEVEKVTLRLISRCRMRIDSQSNHIERVVSVVSEVPQITNADGAGGNKTSSATVNMTVPLTPALCPPSLATARLQSTYELQFLFEIPGVKDPCHSFPIMITYTVDGENVQPAVNTNANVYNLFDENSRKEYTYHAPSQPIAVPKFIGGGGGSSRLQRRASFQSNNSGTPTESNNNSNTAPGGQQMKKSSSQTSIASAGHSIVSGANSNVSRQPAASSSRSSYPAQSCWGKPLLHCSSSRGPHSNHTTNQFENFNSIWKKLPKRERSKFFQFADTEWDLPHEPLLTARANASDTLQQKRSALSDLTGISSGIPFNNSHRRNSMNNNNNATSISITPPNNGSIAGTNRSTRQSMRSDITGPVCHLAEEELSIAVSGSSNTTSPSKMDLKPSSMNDQSFLSARMGNQAASTSVSNTVSPSHSANSGGSQNNVNNNNVSKNSSNSAYGNNNADDLDADLLGNNNTSSSSKMQEAESLLLLQQQRNISTNSIAIVEKSNDNNNGGAADDDIDDLMGGGETNKDGKSAEVNGNNKNQEEENRQYQAVAVEETSLL